MWKGYSPKPSSTISFSITITCMSIKIHQFLDQAQGVASDGGNGSGDHDFAVSFYAFLPSVDQAPVFEWQREVIPHSSSQR